MTFETRVLVGGQWTTRTMDIHQVLAQNREKATPRSPSLPGEVTEPPSKAGILTRTLLRSPMVNWILPARIRHKNKNDVLFIGRDSVEVKELSGDCHLEDVAVKSDFGSTIRSARVLGAPVALPESYGLDAIIKSEELDEMVLDADGPLQIPPQILVLALESKMLVFLFAFYDRHDKIQYISSQRALPPQRSYLEQLGKHMAVDPKSRALAVAACEGSFCLYALKTMDQLREEIESDGGFRQGNFMPIREERHFSVEGIILKMEFLHPPQGENNHVILLLVISLNQRTRLLCYEWDCSTDLRQAKQKGDGQLVHPEDSHPLLLIPFTISSGFMLVCEKVISVYKGILTGPATRRWLALDHYEPPQDPGNSRRPPLWTHWAKPVRHGEYASNHNDIYLCREDGIVRWLEIDEASEGEDAMIGSQMYPGNIGCNIDTAFASLDQPTNRPDLLVSSGDTSNGGLFIIRPSQYIEPRATQTIHNWAPTIDFVTARVSSSSHGIQRHVSSSNEGPMFRERIFACTGRGSKHGAVSELRYGVEARIGTSVEIEDGVLDLWALSALSGGDTFVLLSYSATTMLLHIPSDLGNSESEIKLVEDENMGLYFDARTITAGVTTEDFIIQITESSIHVTSFVAAKHRWSRQCKEERIVAADICRTNPATVTALRRGEDVYLHLATLSTSGEHISLDEFGEPILLPSEPACLSLHLIGEQYLAFVGTLASTLQIFRASIGSGFVPIVEYNFDGHFAICDSIALLSRQNEVQNQPSEILLLCGLRNGSVEILRIRPQEDSNTDVVTSCGTIAIGSTSVRVMQDKNTDSCALLLCGPDICRMTYSPKALYSSEMVHSIWLTDQGQPALQQGELSAIAQADIWTTTDEKGASTPSLFCVEGNLLHLAALDTRAAPRVVTRRIPVAGTPSRIIFSTRLNMLIVGYSMTEVKFARPPQRPRPKRVFRPMIDFIFPDGDPVKTEPCTGAENPNTQPRHAFWRPGERIHGLLEWFPSEGGKSYHMLVVNTMIGHATTFTAKGRILFLNIARDENTGRVRLTEKHRFNCEKPVFSVAAYGPSSLLYGTGNELVLQTLRVSERKWDDKVTHNIRSPAFSISVTSPFIYVMTARHSLLIFKFENNTLIPQFSDDVARDGLHHLHLPDSAITLASDKFGIVAGLWQPPKRPVSNSVTTLFEAVLPASITRLRQGFVKPPWRIPKVSSSSPDPTEIAPSILGSSADGAIYQFTILNEAEWRLLRFIQNMAMRSPVVCPFTGQGTHEIHIEPSTDKLHYMQVDGDILARILERGGLYLLREMLEAERTKEQRYVDFDTPQERQRRFEELVEEALEMKVWEDPLEIAMGYLMRAVQPAL